MKHRLHLHISKNNTRLQSTVEYLITHMWAILIISIGLVALFLLGVFTPGVPQQCILGNSLVCESYIMNINGVLSLNILNSGSTPINVTGVACYNNQSNINYQAPDTPSGQLYLPTGSEETFTLQCYNNAQSYSGTVGIAYSGDIAVNYVNILTGIAGSSTGTIGVKPSTANTILVKQYGVIFSDSVQIKNSQTSPIPSGFQQMFSINPSTFAQNGLNANMSNMEFTSGSYGSGIQIPAWIESGASNTATTSIIWLKLPEGITSNGGTETLYMNFLSNNDPVTSGITGYAPQLWCASGCFQTGYAQYDNGANIFTSFYQNFKGTATPSGWMTSATGMINNGLMLTGLGEEHYAQTNAQTYGQNPNLILDFYAYVNIIGACDNYASTGFGYETLNSGNPANDVMWANEACAGIQTLDPAARNGNSGGNFGPQLSVGNYLLSVYWASNTAYSFYYNYQQESVSIPTQYFPTSPTAIGGMLIYESNTLPIYYIRLRDYPPNGAKPIVSCTTGTCTN